MTTIDLVKHIGQRDKRDRRRNICAQIKREYYLQNGHGSCNIIVPAKKRREKTVITAHYDVFPGSCGYNDNAAGIVSILRIIDSLPDNVEVVFTDNEEHGGAGAAVYIDEYKDSIRCNINIDVIGLGENIYYDTRCDRENIIRHPLNSRRRLKIPFNDSHVFEYNNIPAIIFISGSATIEHVIDEIWNAQHGNKNDNTLEVISAQAIKNMSGFLTAVLQNEQCA